MEAEEVQTKTRFATATRAGFCVLLSVSDLLLVALTHVGHNSVSVVVLFRLRLHGRNEPAANREWTATLRVVASSETVEYCVRYNRAFFLPRTHLCTSSTAQLQTLLRPRLVPPGGFPVHCGAHVLVFLRGGRKDTQKGPQRKRIRTTFVQSGG